MTKRPKKGSFHQLLIQKIRDDKKFAEEYFQKAKGKYLVDKNMDSFNVAINNLLEAGCMVDLKWKSPTAE